MCQSCWEELGSPKIDSPKVREAAASIAALYEHYPSGGPLHCQVDDYNVDDWLFDEEYRPRAGDEGVNPGSLEAAQKCFDLLKALTEQERLSALALHDQYWSPTT